MRPDEEPDGGDPPQGDAARRAAARVARRPNLTTVLAALEEAITCTQTAQTVGEANPVRLESLILILRDQRGRVLDMLEEP